MSATITELMTADELLAMPDDGYRYELVKGELNQMPPAGFEHGVVTIEITRPLTNHVEAHKLGVVCAAETGFLLTEDPDTVHAPDAAFITNERVQRAGTVRSYWKGAPDLAIEVLSPSDSVRQVEEKVAEWLQAGTRMVLVLSSRLRTITVYRSLTDVQTLTEKDALDCDDVVPGFRIAVSEIFGAQ